MLSKADKRFFIRLSSLFECERILVSFEKIQDIANSFVKNSKNAKEMLKRIQKAGYIELIFTDKHGKPYVYMLLLKKGADYITERKARKKEVVVKMLLAFFSAIITFVFGKILYLFFS